MNSKICSVCSNLEIRRDNKWNAANWCRYLDVPLDALQKSAATSSCRSCSLLWRASIAIVGLSTINQFGKLKILGKAKPSGGPLQAELHQSKGTKKVALQFYVLPGQRSPWAQIGATQNLSPNGLSDSCVRLVQKWLEDCTQPTSKHQLCQRPPPAPLPTRVISVGKTDADLRLYITRPGDKTKYIALSHCWGGTTPIKLEQASLGIFSKRGIPWQKLPQTFRDAVAVTRRLGIAYLWIDSLCIIQDSPDDWATQAGRMASVYENSYVTIAAHAAPDSTTGFLASPARRVKPSIRIPCTDEKGKPSCDIQLREGGDQSSLNSPWHGPSSDNAMKCSKLSTRAWVFQESLLAPRTLTFAATELAWECRSTTACECSAPLNSQFSGEENPGSLKAPIKQLEWRAVVQKYTTKDLTNNTDRLPALSGIAEAMGQLLKDQYLCGLWRKDLVSHLLWGVPDAKECKRFSKTYAPTWSWASVNKPVQYDYSRVRPGTIRFLDVHCQPSLNPYGPVKDAYLQVSALVIVVRILHRGPPSSKAYPSEIVPFRSTSAPDGATLGLLLDNLDRDGKSDLDGVKSGLLFCVVAGDSSSGIRGLLLKEARGTRGAVFERVGYAFPHVDAISAEKSYQGWISLAERRELRLV